MRNDPIQTAEQLIRRDYPDCLIAVLGGSAGRGEHNEQSDLDIMIINETAEGLERKTVEEAGWVVELFFLSDTGYREVFDAGVMSANPTLQRILAEGVVIHSRPEGMEIRDEAQSDLDYGPLPLTTADIDELRYNITEYMKDLEGAVKPVEVWFTAQALTSLLCEFKLRVHTRWIGEGKALFRFLTAFDPETAARLEESLDKLYGQGQREPLLQLAADVLRPYGGPFLVGFET